MAVEIEGDLVRRVAVKDKSVFVRHRAASYDWDKWLNGKQWMLSQGVDFEVALGSFRSAAFIAVRKRGLKLRTHLVEDDQGRPAVCIQAYSPTQRELLFPPVAAVASDVNAFDASTFAWPRLAAPLSK